MSNSNSVADVRQREFIVGQVSKTWADLIDGKLPVEAGETICVLFERLIESNRIRGYEPHTWKYSRVMTCSNSMSERIVAVFRLRKFDGKGQPIRDDEVSE